MKITLSCCLYREWLHKKCGSGVSEQLLVTVLWGAQHRSLIWRLSLVTPYWAASPVLANTSIQYSVYDVPTLAPPLLTTTSLTSTETIRLTSRPDSALLITDGSGWALSRQEWGSIVVKTDRGPSCHSATPATAMMKWTRLRPGLPLSAVRIRSQLDTPHWQQPDRPAACSNTLPVPILLFIINAILPKIHTGSGLWFNLTLKNLMFSFLAKINDWIQNQSWIFYRWQKLQIYSCFSKSKRLWSMFLAGALDFNSV